MTKIVVKKATLGLVEGSDIEELKDLKDDLANDASEGISKIIEQKLDRHEKETGIIEIFKRELEGFAEEIKIKTKAPLIFIIDELDRCRPDYALEVIEKIKHFFSVKNLVFVLVMHKYQLECAVKSIYGNEIDAVTYLQKFINLECALPKNADQHNSDYKKYCDYLYLNHDLDTWKDRDELQRSMISFSEGLGLSLRDLEKCYINLILFYSSVSKGTLRIPVLIAFLSILKIGSSPNRVGKKWVHEGRKANNGKGIEGFF